MTILKSNFSKLILLLAVIAVLSAVAAMFLHQTEKLTPPAVTTEQVRDIYAAVEMLFARYDIDKKSVRKRTISSNNGAFRRSEQRIDVSPEFNTLSFNHDLGLALGPVGASAIATEKSEDKSVTIHIKKDQLIVESLVFLIKREAPTKNTGRK